MSVVAEVLRGNRIHPDVSFVLFPASQQVLETMARQGLVADLIAAGAVISESTCGACPGIGHVPATGSRSLRAFNRNFPGRSGVKGDQVYLSSTQTACVSALRGEDHGPAAARRGAGRGVPGALPPRPGPGLVLPAPDGQDAPVVKGPNIREVPVGRPPGDEIAGPVLIKLGDKVSTDDISPSGSQVLVFRSNMPAISEFTFRNTDPEFVARAKAQGGGFIVAGQTYGQGSSREAAAIGPMFLGVRGVLAKTFARIHRANLINWGVLPLELADAADYDALAAGHELRISGCTRWARRRRARRRGRDGRPADRGALRPHRARAGDPARGRTPGPHPRAGRLGGLTQRRVRAVFVRGGTSRALLFHRRDLPADRAAWDPIFLAALGSPDPNGRQLDGLGGGISSLSKVAVVGPPSRPDADVDYTFGQVEVTRAAVDYRGNCGNISSAIGPFAIDEALVPAREPDTVVRIHNTNTGKLIHAHVTVDGGTGRRDAATSRSTACQAPARASRSTSSTRAAPSPAGSCPRATPRTCSRSPGSGPSPHPWSTPRTPWCSCAPRTSAWTAPSGPDDLDARPGLPARLEAIRGAAAVSMGLAQTPEEAARTSTAVPKIAIVAPPAAYRTLSGAVVEPDGVDLVARIVSMGKVHRAFALTGAMCLAVAARIPGTLAHEAAAFSGASGDVRIGHPSGVLAVAAAVRPGPDGHPVAQTVTVYRTARRLMEGSVLVP